MEREKVLGHLEKYRPIISEMFPNINKYYDTSIVPVTARELDRAKQKILAQGEYKDIAFLQDDLQEQRPEKTAGGTNSKTPTRILEDVFIDHLQQFDNEKQLREYIMENVKERELRHRLRNTFLGA